MPADRTPQARQRAVELVDHRCTHGTCARKGSYVLESRCSNCGWTGEIAVTLGHEAAGARSTAQCPRCECRTLRNGNFVRSEAPDA